MAQKTDSSKSDRNRNYGTVVAARFSALGDVAMTLPVLYSACRCYPGIRFVMVTKPSVTGIFVNAPTNLTVVGADIKNEYAGVGGLRRLVDWLVAEYGPFRFVDLHNVLRTKVMTAFMRLRGVPCSTLEKPRRRRHLLTRRHNKVILPLKSQRDYYRDVFLRADLPVASRFDGLFDGPGRAHAELFAAITAPKPDGQKWIGIAPFAAHQCKIYPVDLMERVIAMLQTRADRGAGLRVFLFGGGEAEADWLDGIAAKYPACTSLADKRYGFPAELALFNHMDAVVTMDSANMHLAAIAGAPLLSIWGATHPYCGFRAWHQSDSTTIQVPLECRPCSVYGNKPCARGDLLCLCSISPDVVFARIAELAQFKKNS